MFKCANLKFESKVVCCAGSLFLSHLNCHGVFFSITISLSHHFSGRQNILIILISLLQRHILANCDFGFSVELPKVREDGRSMFTAKGFARSEGYYRPELNVFTQVGCIQLWGGEFMIESWCLLALSLPMLY